MISFIIIGRNEGWKLTKCLKSVLATIAYNHLKDYEIIYVDSDSDDNSIETAEKFEKTKVFKITGDCNAAVARNIGATAASGEILFFMDGDTELKPFDIKLISNDEVKLEFGYVVGFLDNVNYRQDWSLINQTPRGHASEMNDQKVTMAGGAIFIIEKKTWHEFGGMDERLTTTEDRDLCLRMARKGIVGIRRKEIFGYHHTIPYNDSRRMWQRLFDGLMSYKGVTIRKHLLNRFFMPIFLREEWTMIIMIICLLLLFESPLFLLVYLSSVFVRNGKYFFQGKNFIFNVLHRIIQDIIVFLSVPFFYPSRLSYKVIQIK